MSATHALPRRDESTDAIRTRPCPKCYVCERQGELLYEILTDRLFGAPGKWNLKRCSDPKCGMVWLDPVPLEEDISKAYRAYYTHEADVPPADNFARRLYSRIQAGYVRTKYHYRQGGHDPWDQLSTLLAYLNPIRRANFDLNVFCLHAKPNGRLLEVGCGSGTMLKSMQGLGWKVEGVDFDPAAVEAARKKGLSVHLGTLSEQEFRANSFDAIIMGHCIEHVPDPINLLRECYRILKPGGRLVVITPNVRSWGHRLYGADWRGLEPPRHLHIFTLSSLAAVCARAGFTGYECRSAVRANGIHLASRMLRKGKLESRPPSWNLRLLAEATGLAQWALSLVDREAGEEIVLISLK